MPPRPRMRVLPSGRFALIGLLVIVAIAVARQGRASTTVPPVVGESLSAARAALNRAQLRVSLATPVPRRCGPTVTGTAPRVGSRVSRNHTVVLSLRSASCGVPPARR